MNSGLILRVCLLGFLVLVLMAVWHRIQDANDGIKLLFFIVLGAGGGIWAIKVLIPWLGETLGTFVYSSGEEIQLDDSMKAAAKVAQGDYDGAIAEYEKLAREHPQDPKPVAEIAKIHSEHFHDPAAAIQVLEKHWLGREWAPDDAAFLMFRIAETHSEKLGDFESARGMLEQVVALFPNSRHSANAHHRLNEMDQAKLKKTSQPRLKSGGNA